jgi:hypothetical protein
LELVKDWCDYTDAMHKLAYARDMLDVDTGDNAYDTYGDRVKEPHITRQEIEKRFQEALGKKFIDRWVEFREKKPNTFDKIFEEAEASA